MEEKLRNIMKKMEEIHYGWVDKYHVVHKNAKKEFFLENYHFMSVEDILKYKVGTCFEQAALVEYYLEEEGIEANKYMISYNDPDKIARHTFVVVPYDGMFYLLEPSWVMRNETICFPSLESIFEEYIKILPKMYKLEPFVLEKVEIFAYTECNVGDTYSAFSENVQKGEKFNF